MHVLNLCPILFSGLLSRGMKRADLLSEKPGNWASTECKCLGEACQWFIEGDCAVIPVGSIVEEPVK
jgi:hypothetical protein